MASTGFFSPDDTARDLEEIAPYGVNNNDCQPVDFVWLRLLGSNQRPAD